MLNLDTKTRDELVRVLQVQIVPASAGAVLMQVAQILANLKEEVVPVNETKNETTPHIRK